MDYDRGSHVRESRVWNEGNIVFAVFLGLLFAAAELISVVFLELNKPEAIFLAVILFFVYAVFLLFLIDPVLLREIKHTDFQTIEKPVIQTIEKPVIRTVEKIIEKPVIRTIEKIIEKPVIKTVRKIVEKRVPVYIEKKRKKLNIPRYEYFGSTETKVYHHKSCRLRKLIKRKYKATNNHVSYFKSRKYRPCKVCILHKRKI